MFQHALADLIGSLNVCDGHGAVGEILAIVQQPVNVRQNRVAEPELAKRATPEPLRHGFCHELREIIAR